MAVEVLQRPRLGGQSALHKEVGERILVWVINRTYIGALDKVIPGDDLNPFRMSDVDRVHPHVPHTLVSAVLEIASRIGAPKLKCNRGHIELTGTRPFASLVLGHKIEAVNWHLCRRVTGIRSKRSAGRAKGKRYGNGIGKRHWIPNSASATQNSTATGHGERKGLSRRVAKGPEAREDAHKTQRSTIAGRSLKRTGTTDSR
jgi:hypothetical protein